MKKEFTSGSSWNSASVAGLIMGAATIILTIISSLLARTGGIGGGILQSFYLLIKIAACILIFKKLMTRFMDSFEGVDRRRLYNYGLKIALLSAIIVAGYSLLTIVLADPETLKDTMNKAIEAYSSQLDSNSIAAFEAMQGKIPSITFFATLIYCFLWGWILSAIESRGLISDDPFDSEGSHDDTQTTF